MRGIIEPSDDQSAFDHDHLADGPIVTAIESKWARRRRVGQDVSNNTPMDNRNDQLVWMPRCNLVERALDSSMNLHSRLSTGNHIPALFRLHLQVDRIIFKRLDSKQAALPLAQMNLSKIRLLNWHETQITRQWCGCLMSTGQIRNVDGIDRQVPQAFADPFGLLSARLSELRIALSIDQRKWIFQASCARLAVAN